MRNFRTIAVIICLLTCQLVSAKQLSTVTQDQYYEPIRVGMYRVKNTLSMNVLVEKDAGLRVHIRLLDSSGKVLHQEFVGRGVQRIAQKFDFSQVSDGKYVIEIGNDEEKVTKNISLATTEIAEIAGRKLVALN